MCLTLRKAHDGNIDYLGDIDEPKLCRSNDYQSSDENFQCISDTDELCIKPEDLCYQSHCQDGTDEQFCDKNRGITLDTTICDKQYESVRSEVENFFCTRQFDANKPTASYTLQFQTFSDSRRTLFVLIILLIDDTYERIIHSYQQLTYIYIRDCQTKFNIYLLYSTRSKNLTKNDFIHIDIYEKISFTYRKSFLIPLEYPLLPVHRIAVQLNIPCTNDRQENCLNQPCIHGQCIRYSNNSNNDSFCQCYREWTGKYCTISYRCTCSSDSLCIDISSNNRSICICPLHKWSS
ncbi:unnamed protein product [Rotaria sordida]|nr:unnamed protein product [Rotaria sordida]